MGGTFDAGSINRVTSNLDYQSPTGAVLRSCHVLLPYKRIKLRRRILGSPALVATHRIAGQFTLPKSSSCATYIKSSPSRLLSPPLQRLYWQGHTTKLLSSFNFNSNSRYAGPPPIDTVTNADCHTSYRYVAVPLALHKC